jgi:hypothetical protein
MRVPRLLRHVLTACLPAHGELLRRRTRVHTSERGCLVNSHYEVPFSCFVVSPPRGHGSSVANFRVKSYGVSQPGLWEGLRGQRVELFGRGETTADSAVHLAFPQHVHQFNTNQSLLRSLKGFKVIDHGVEGTGRDPCCVSQLRLGLSPLNRHVTASTRSGNVA